MMTMLHHMENINRDIFKRNGGTSLVVQWLRLHTSTAGDTGLNPGQGSFESCMVLQKKKNQMEILDLKSTILTFTREAPT